MRTCRVGSECGSSGVSGVRKLAGKQQVLKGVWDAEFQWGQEEPELRRRGVPSGRGTGRRVSTLGAQGEGAEVAQM